MDDGLVCCEPFTHLLLQRNGSSNVARRDNVCGLQFSGLPAPVLIYEPLIGRVATSSPSQLLTALPEGP
jgi:hypothetical protein